MPLTPRPSAAANGQASTGAFFDACQTLFDSASRSGVTARTLRLGGRPIRIEMTSEALLDALWPPLALLAAGCDRPDLRIMAWEGIDAVPPLPADMSVLGRGGMVLPLTSESTRVAIHMGSRLLMALDLDNARAFFWAPDATRLPWWERAAPLRSLLGWWVDDAGQQLVHAAGVALGDRCALLAGRAGSGKSTTALSCLRDPDLGLIGDDYVLLRPDPLRAEPLYGCAKLEAEHLVSRLSWLAPLVVNPDGGPTEKRVVTWASAHPERVTHTARVVAVVVPRVTEAARSSLRPTSRARALAELAPTTVFQLSGSSGRTLSRLAAWIRPLPAYELLLGNDPRSTPTALRTLLAPTGERGS